MAGLFVEGLEVGSESIIVLNEIFFCKKTSLP